MCVCWGGGEVKGGQCQCGHPLRECSYIYLKFCEAEVFSRLCKMVVSFQAQLK